MAIYGGKGDAVIADVDVWRAANILFKKHGEDAVLVASQRADAMIADADVDGFLIWLAIVKAINELRRGTRVEGDAVN